MNESGSSSGWERLGRLRGRWAALWLLLLWFGLSACKVTGAAVLPTRALAAAAPPTQMTAATPVFVEVPATYTPVARTGAPEAGQPTHPPAAQTATALALTGTPTPTASPTLAMLPQPMRATSAQSLETPPDRVACAGQGTVFRSRFPSLRGGSGGYHAYLPPCYGWEDRTYPVLYLIHGSIQTDSHWLDLGLARIADAAIASGRFPPFIAVMPYSDRLGNISSGGDNSVEAMVVNHLIPYVEAHFCAWRSPLGRSIGGISRGGYWALEIAFRHQELFAAVAGHSSHLRFETDPARYNPLATYAQADLSRMRIWLDRGEKDFLRVGQDQLSRSLAEAGIDHVYRVNPGGHNEAYWAAHLGEYLDWHAAGWPKDPQVYPGCGSGS